MKAPRIESLTEKKLVGKRLRMNLANNKTFELWKSFMQQRREIYNNINTDLISMQVFDPSHDFNNFNLHTEFEKWAVAEVSDFDSVPHGMETFTLSGGLYAVFIHEGDSNEFAKTFQHIFGVWLPNSDFLLDPRPHFEVLGEQYKLNSADSSEEVWIPVRRKG